MENGWLKIAGIQWEVDVEEVKHTPLCGTSANGRLVWHYDSKGEFTVRSGYHLAMSHDEFGSDGIKSGFSRGLKKLWGLRILS